jgi:hypothetical protein
MDLEAHPDLTPLIEMTPDGKVKCFGWASPIYEFNNPGDLK